MKLTSALIAAATVATSVTQALPIPPIPKDAELQTRTLGRLVDGTLEVADTAIQTAERSTRTKYAFRQLALQDPLKTRASPHIPTTPLPPYPYAFPWPTTPLRSSGVLKPTANAVQPRSYSWRELIGRLRAQTRTTKGDVVSNANAKKRLYMVRVNVRRKQERGALKKLKKVKKEKKQRGASSSGKSSGKNLDVESLFGSSGQS